MNRDPQPLTFEEFIPKLHRFCLYFAQGSLGKIYRGSYIYQKCMEEHQQEFDTLSKELQARKDIENPEYRQKSYRAYQLMRPYAERDNEMFV